MGHAVVPGDSGALGNATYQCPTLVVGYVYVHGNNGLARAPQVARKIVAPDAVAFEFTTPTRWRLGSEDTERRSDRDSDQQRPHSWRRCDAHYGIFFGAHRIGKIDLTTT